MGRSRGTNLKTRKVSLCFLMSEFLNAVHDGRGRWHLETSHAQHHRALFALPARTRSAGSSVHLHQVVPRCVGLINKLLQCSNSSPNRLAGAGL